LLLILATGIPIGIGLALVGMTILYFFAGGAMGLATTAVWNVFTDFTLSAVPIFIVFGEIMLLSGISERLYSALAPLFRRVPGQLLHTNIVVCTLFGAVSGSSMATAAAIGSVAYPELKARGYNPASVVGTLAAGGTLGLLIPPSLSLLIYGATQSVSIGQLFLAGIMPGLMFAIFFMSWILFVNVRNPQTGLVEQEPMPFMRQLLGLLKLWPVGVLVFSVLGTIYAGLATPTEAAGLGVAAAIVIGFTWGDLTAAKLWRAFVSSTLVFAVVAVVVLGALILAQAISILGLPRQLMDLIGTMGLSSYLVLLLVVVVYLVLGCFFDGISLLLMTLPVVFPLMTGLGFDPVWLGVMLTILIEIGMLTPPVGVNLFVLVGISKGDVSPGTAALATLPYWLILLGGAGVITLLPPIATLLPDLVY